MSKIKRSLKIAHHTNSGKLRPHEHTSYVPLAFLLLVVGFALATFSSSVQSATPYDGPEAGSVGLTGIMPGKPPQTAATINMPSNGQRFSTSPVTVSGTCPKDTLVEIYKNDIFAGSTVCSDKGTYTLEVDLLIGQNTLIARVYDALNQQGPDSNKVIVYYDALPPQSGALTPFNFGGNQLLINTDAVFRGVFPDQTMVVPLDVLGGTPPYAINIEWGDATNKVVPRNDNATFNVEHVYKKPGTYQIIFQASDAGGRVAFLTVAAIVNGQPDVVAASTKPLATPNQLLLLWPIFVGAVAVTISFWLGEQREKHVLQKHGLLAPTHS
jgi:hypothetical protein